MRRGDLVTIAAGGPFAGKPRPAVIVQSDEFQDIRSVTVCLLTGEEVEMPFLRLRLVPDDGNNLVHVSRIMVDKIVTVRRDQIGRRFGKLADEDIFRLNRALTVFLGLAG